MKLPLALACILAHSSRSLEKSGVHRRLAIYMVRLVGVDNGRRVVIGFMLAAAFLSMWISNTAATLILLPIALAALQNVDDNAMAIALTLRVCRTYKHLNKKYFNFIKNQI